MKIVRFSVNNPVAVNIIMFAVIVMGIYTALTITREFFPQADFDRVIVHVAYPGATPEEVEKGVVTKIEREVENLAGIEEISSQALENFGIVVLKVKDRDLNELADEVRNEIDTIDDFPEEAEEAFVEVLEQQVPAISIVIYGAAPERRLKQVADEVQDELLASPLISRAFVSGTREEEISIEVHPQLLEAYGLTLGEVGRAVSANNVDLAGGEIKAPTGKILVRTLGEEDTALPLEEMIIRGTPEGQSVRLFDVADVREAFEETALRGGFHGQRAVQVTVFKRGEEDAVRISSWVKDYIREKSTQFVGEDIQFEYRVDLARFISERIELMARNALQGLVLVFISLALFLNLRLAFWVGVGLLVSFLGTFVIMDILGETINLISLFGLIIVVGLIVDDAIVVSENIYAKLEEGKPPHVAAVEGTEEVAGPVVATVLTTVVAFAPLAFVEGVIGDFFTVLPIVVMISLMLSLTECFTLLPSHLAEYGKVSHPPTEEEIARRSRLTRGIHRVAGRAAEIKDEWLGRRLTNLYVTFLKTVLRWRYVTVGVAIFISQVTVALIVIGWLPFVLLPKVDAETLVVEVEMSQGTRAEQTEQVLKDIAAAADDFSEIKSLYSVVGFKEEAEVQNFSDPAVIGEVIAELVEADQRVRNSETIKNDWRERVGHVPGAVKLKFRDRSGGPPGSEIEARVRGPNQEVVEAAVRFIKEKLADYVGVKDIEDDGGTGKLEMRIRMKPAAVTLGVSEVEIARQIRSAFFGYQAQILQRGREELKVWVRLDEESRKSVAELLRLRITTPTGERIPLSEIADVEMTRGLSVITRVDGLRTVTVFADVDFAKANTAEVTAYIEKELAGIGDQFPGVRVSFEGAKKETSESLNSLLIGFPVGLFFIYCILAVLFRSYLQPFLVMVAIPYGAFGAFLGHLLFGLIPGRESLPISFPSLIGIVGLSGIVVNDSLILVSFINDYRRQHPGQLFKAVVEAGRRRFRPIILTSITTVLGLFPIMLETSFQAQFLIPLAISISFGLTLATVLTLLLLPCLYMIMEDIRTVVHWLVTGRWEIVRLKPTGLLEGEGQATT